MQAGDGQDMDHTPHLVAQFQFIIQIAFFSQKHRFKHWSVAARRFLKDFAKTIFQIQKRLPVTGITAALFLYRRVFHKIIDMLAGIILL